MATEQKRILVRRGNKADLVVTDLQPGELVLALDTNEIGVKTSGGTVLWFATLNSNGKVIQDPASYGQPSGGATLNAQGKVIQDPATAYLPLPETDDNSTNQHWAKYADGTMHQWGFVTDTISVTTAVGSMYMLSPYTFTLPQRFTKKESVNGSAVSNGLLVAINTSGAGSGSQLTYRILSPTSVSNLEITLMYDAWGRWK